MSETDDLSQQGATAILGIDFGQRRIGVACTDALGILAQPVEMVPGEDESAALRRLAELAEQKGARTAVIGLARHMRSGEESETAKASRAFGAKLAAATGLEVVYLDERLTSRLAEQTLDSTLGRSSKKRRKAERAGRVDVMAACLLLQSYLDARRSRAERANDEEQAEREQASGDPDSTENPPGTL